MKIIQTRFLWIQYVLFSAIPLVPVIIGLLWPVVGNKLLENRIVESFLSFYLAPGLFPSAIVFGFVRGTFGDSVTMTYLFIFGCILSTLIWGTILWGIDAMVQKGKKKHS